MAGVDRVQGTGTEEPWALIDNTRDRGAYRPRIPVRKGFWNMYKYAFYKAPEVTIAGTVFAAALPLFFGWIITSVKNDKFAKMPKWKYIVYRKDDPEAERLRKKKCLNE